MLIKCKACGKEMSKLADTCPNCSHPNKTPEKKRKETAELITGVIFIILVAMAVWWLWS